MFEVFEWSRHFLLRILETLWFLVRLFLWDTICWRIGWLVLRALTFGRFPEEPIGEVDQADAVHWNIVVIVGLLTLAASIWLLSGAWPSYF